MPILTVRKPTVTGEHGVLNPLDRAHEHSNGSSNGLSGESHGRVAELLENPPENLRMSAVDQALDQTFTNSPGKLAQSLQSLKAQFPALTVILPFVRTPALYLRSSGE